MLLADIGLWQVYQYQPLCSLIGADIDATFKTGKNAWISDLKRCNYLVCPAEVVEY